MRFYKKLRNLATITTVSTICVYLINKLVFSLSSMKDALFSKYGNTYSWRFGSLYYTKHGTGSPLLLIHDLNNCSSELEFYKIKEELSRSHTVYTLDLLGCGRSDKPRITYTSYLYVQLINDFIKNVIGTKTDIISSGKSSSLIFLACYTEPRNFSRLMMINPENMTKAGRYPGNRKKVLKYFMELPIIGTLTYNILHSRPMIQKKLAREYFHRPKDIKQKYVDICHESAHKCGSDTKYLYASLISDYLNCNLIPSIKNLNHSIYFLMGDHTPEAENTIEQYQVLNPSVEYHFIKRSKLLPHLENPDEVLKACKIFF